MNPEGSDGWKFPQGITIDDISMELDITPISIPEISSNLTALNDVARKEGVQCLRSDMNFKKIFSAIYHFDGLSDKDWEAEFAWDALNRAFRVSQQSASRSKIDLLSRDKAIFICCKLMEVTSKRNKSMSKKKNDAAEIYAGHWAKHMNFLLPKGQNNEISQEGASMISSGCWSVFSSSKKNKSLRDRITAIIGQILNVIGSQDVAINVIKIVKSDDSLAEFFAEVIVNWIVEHEARGLIGNIIHELNQISETKAQSGLVTLVSSIAKKKPDEMIRHIPMIEQLIADSDLKYWAREAGLSVMAAIYKHQLQQELQTGENDPLNQSQLQSADSEEDQELSVKDRTFQFLSNHIYDRTAYARSYTLRIFEKMASEIRLPVSGEYMERIVSRFEDNTSSVRKSAIQAFSAILQQHIFLEQIRNIDLLRSQIEGSEEAVPQLKMMLRDCQKIHDLIKKGSEICLSLLRSTLATDTCEAIKWFYRITVLNIKGADMNGFRAMAVYVWSSEEKIRDEVLNAYKDVYFNETQRPEATAIGLIFLVRNCSRAESSSIGKMIELIGIPQRARDELWRYALGKNTNGETLTDSVRASAVAIISMLAKNPQNNQLNDANTELLIQMIDDESAGPITLAELCDVLTHLRPNVRKPMADGALEKEHEIFQKLEGRLVKEIKNAKEITNLANFINNSIGLFYRLCASPSELVTNILGMLVRMSLNLLQKGKDKEDARYKNLGLKMLSVALHAAGHATLQLAIWVECSVVPSFGSKLFLQVKI